MADKLVSQDPTKPGLFKVTGPTVTATNQIALSSLDTTVGSNGDVIAKSAGVWGPSAAPPSADTASNLGAGSQSFKSKVGADFQFRSIIGAGSITGVQNANDITLTGAVITGSNLGAGNGVFSAKVANDLQFKSLIAGANVTLTPTATDITIALAGSSSPFSASFTSAAQTVTFGGTLTLAHGLGGAPTLIMLILKNVTAEAGYVTGDQEIHPPGANNNASNQGIATYIDNADVTNIKIRYGSSGILVLDKSSGVTTSITAANWNLIVKAWR